MHPVSLQKIHKGAHLGKRNRLRSIKILSGWTDAGKPLAQPATDHQQENGQPARMAVCTENLVRL